MKTPSIGRILIVAVAIGAAEPGNVARAVTPSPAMDHQVWDGILNRFVDEEGRVAYRRLGVEAGAELNGYLDRLAEADPSSWPVQDRIAFWLNAYNAGILAGVLDGQSPESTFTRVRMFRWYAFEVAGKKRSPHEIEHEVLRKRFDEPRIHFALVCAASSCPRLRREAYRGDRLDEQLDDQGRHFINESGRNVIDPATARIEISPIFDWFESDFTAAAGSLGGFVARYVETPEQAALLKEPDARIRFTDYDWSLNAQPGQRP